LMDHEASSFRRPYLSNVCRVVTWNSWQMALRQHVGADRSNAKLLGGWRRERNCAEIKSCHRDGIIIIVVVVVVVLYTTTILFHSRTRRPYLYHCVYSGITCRNYTNVQPCVSLVRQWNKCVKLLSIVG